MALPSFIRKSLCKKLFIIELWLELESGDITHENLFPLYLLGVFFPWVIGANLTISNEGELIGGQ